MPVRLTPEDAQQSLAAHVAVKGAELHQKYGPNIGWNELLRILEDRVFCRYPCEIVFDAAPLLSGELAHPVAKGAVPEAGFVMHVHPLLLMQPQKVAGVVLYQLVVVNYGEFATAQDAEAFGAAALNISVDDYYRQLCELADGVGGNCACGDT